MSTEDWRPVRGYEGLYEVSSRGQVRSLPRVVIGIKGAQAGRIRYRRKGRLLAPTTDPNAGHRFVRLSRNGVKLTKRVNRLVLEAFTEPPPRPGLFACHINGVSDDDRPENLYWGTQSDNQHDSVRHGTHHMARVTHCRAGHPYDEANTYRITQRNGSIKRDCRACRRNAARRYREGRAA